MAEKFKILVCGDVDSKLDTLFSKITALNKKSPFHFLFCVGNFFSGSRVEELQDYKTGKKTVPIPTFILGANDENELKTYEGIDENNEICENLTYLGKKGIFTSASGFTIAYLSGVECNEKDESKESWNFDKKDIIALRNSCLRNGSHPDNYKGVDFLLTSQWPEGMVEGEKNTSKLISFLALEIKPRYHFCGLNNLHYEKPPFRFPAHSSDSVELVSRFIGLAKQGNAKKGKFLYAFNAQPLNTMRLTDLMQKSIDEIECPYLVMNFQDIIGNSGSSNQFFFDMNAGDDRKRSRNNDSNRKKFKQDLDQEKCWFCLSSESIEKHLIISVGDNFYIALAKGPLNNYHVLILPTQHIQSAAQLSEDHFQELELFKRALKKYFESKDMVAIFFERNYKTSHLQINAIGIAKDMEWQIKATFDDKSEEFGLSFETIPKLESSKDLPDNAPYFVIELPGNDTLLTRKMNRFPINFGRDFLCAETLLNCEDKIDWRNCLLPKNIENDIVKTFRDTYKDFDFTQDDD
ncbi:unnamed protein product [Diamesa hyperborea]